jgi:CBS domain-containing protein
MMAKCNEVMTRDPASVEPGDSITRAAEFMKRHDVGSLPVVDSHEDQKLIGIVTDRDIVVKVVAGGSNLDRAVVRDAMTANPAFCREDEDVQRAVDLMRDRQVRRMPVTDGQGRLCGIIAQADVATRINRDQTTGELVEAISEPRVVRK